VGAYVPHVGDVAPVFHIPLLLSYALAPHVQTPAHMYSEHTERYWSNINQVCRHEGSRFRMVAHDVRLLLLRLASGRPKLKPKTSMLLLRLASMCAPTILDHIPSTLNPTPGLNPKPELTLRTCMRTNLHREPAHTYTQALPSPSTPAAAPHTAT
jgi:hypothetical protein